MNTLGALVADDNAAITLYSPDTIRSQLIADLDLFVLTRSHLRAGHREWVALDALTAARFYETTALSEGIMQRYIAPHFSSGPSLLTFWIGARALETLRQLKGASHPAKAAVDSIRGGFWCDNKICNLLHSSDSIEELDRELGVLGLQDIYGVTPMGRNSWRGACSPAPPGRRMLSHSGVATLCRVAHSYVGATCPLDIGDIPSRTAVNCMTHLAGELRHIARRSRTIAYAIDAFFAGDVATFTQVEAFRGVDRYEKFVMECSAYTMEDWRATVALDGPPRVPSSGQSVSPR
jgi:nucleoside diphosphate kinase